MIMDRDISIFKLLTSGPSRIDMLFSDYKKITKSSDISKEAFSQRVWSLKKQGYLRSRIYLDTNKKGGKYALYALTNYSAEVLCRKHGYRIESIRMKLPNKKEVAHNIEVTNVVKNIKREASQIIYEFTMFDEYWQRKLRDDNEKKSPIPDLLLKTHFNANGKEKVFLFNVEIDNSTIAAGEIAKKLAKYSFPVLIICTTRKRLMILQKTIYAKRNETVYHDKNFIDIVNDVYLCFLNDFCKTNSGGIVGTTWVKPDGKLVNIMPFTDN